MLRSESISNLPGGMALFLGLSGKVMKGYVMAPLLSSSLVDVNIMKTTVKTGFIYKYKYKVTILPFIMQYDTLTISVHVEGKHKE